jgi:hypothetical protein
VRENGEKNYFDNKCNEKHTQMDRQTDESKHKWTDRLMYKHTKQNRLMNKHKNGQTDMFE